MASRTTRDLERALSVAGAEIEAAKSTLRKWEAERYRIVVALEVIADALLAARQSEGEHDG